MSEQRDFANLDKESWEQLQQILERFENDCCAEFPRDLICYVPPEDSQLRRLVLEELVRTDLELRWQKREGVLVEFYLKDFPELANSDFLPRLLRDEMSVRLKYAAKPDLKEYQKRFPEQYPELSNLAEGLSETGELLPQKESVPVSNIPKEDRKSSSPPDDFVVPIDGATVSDTMSGTFSMAARFKRIRKIGEGAFGEVWEAEAPGGVPVAIKRIFGTVSPKAIERERESLNLICSGKLRHPFLLQVTGWWITNERLHIWMELADESLDDRLKLALRAGKPGLEMSELRQVLIDAADALDFLNHDRNIVHRDVKPANMLLMAKRLKLCDFGLSRMSENLAMFMGRTRGAGTPVFMAPEIIRGYQSVHSDQYSLAMSYFMLRTSKPVYRGKVAEIRKQHLEAVPNLDTGILNRSEQLVLAKALSKETDHRFSSSTEFIRELIAAAESDTVSEFVTAPPQSSDTEEEENLDLGTVVSEPDMPPAAEDIETIAGKANNSKPAKKKPIRAPATNVVTVAKAEPQKQKLRVEPEESQVPVTQAHAGGMSGGAGRNWEPLRNSSSTLPKISLSDQNSLFSKELIAPFLLVFVGTVIATTLVIVLLRMFGIVE